MIKILDKSLTLDEFLKLTETKPYCEYINGKIYQKPMSQGKHSTIQIELASTGNKTSQNWTKFYRIEMYFRR